MKKTKYTFLLILLSQSFGFSQTNPLELWYNRPASVWEETLPLGNGRLGLMPDGGVNTEKLVLNDITLWSGSPQDANNYNAYKSLPKIKELLLAGKNVEAEKLVNENFICTGPGSGSGSGANVEFGCYQVLGNLTLNFDYGKPSKDIKFEKYNRNLNLQTAVASTQFTVDGVVYTREYFTGFGDDVSFIKLSADKKGMLNFTIQLDRPERFRTVVNNDTSLVMTGQLNDGKGGGGMRYKTIVKAQPKDGTLLSDDSKLTVSNATEVIIYVAAGTDFKDKNFEQTVDATLIAAIDKKY